MHYDRWRRSGDPLTVSVIVGDDHSRFWSYVERGADHECWQWTGTLTHENYGVMGVGRGQAKAHRYAYELLVGPIPEGLTLDHLCHTHDLTCVAGNSCPHRSCVNPAHLEPVDSGENVRRGNEVRSRRPAA